MERFLRRVINTMKGFGHGTYREKVLGLFKFAKDKAKHRKNGNG